MVCVSCVIFSFRIKRARASSCETRPKWPGLAIGFHRIVHTQATRTRSLLFIDGSAFRKLLAKLIFVQINIDTSSRARTYVHGILPVRARLRTLRTECRHRTRKYMRPLKFTMCTQARIMCTPPCVRRKTSLCVAQDICACWAPILCASVRRAARAPVTP